MAISIHLPEMAGLFSKSDNVQLQYALTANTNCNSDSYFNYRRNTWQHR